MQVQVQEKSAYTYSVLGKLAHVCGVLILGDHDCLCCF